MDDFEKITQQLKDLGLTAYEAKAYIALLQHNPLTRYQLAKLSGVPRSAIYNSIQKLEKLGAVNAQAGEPQKYIPLPPDQFLELLQRQYQARIDNAKSSLISFETNLVPDHLWNIVGYDNMILKAQELIQKSEKSIYLSVWARELNLLKKDLMDAHQRGVAIIIFSFTKIDFKSGSIYSYGLSEEELEKIWAHKVILITDKSELLMGEADNTQSQRTAWTSNRALIDIATNHIILDITIYGIRLGQSVSTTASQMQNGETTYLDKLLKSKHPGIKF